MYVCIDYWGLVAGFNHQKGVGGSRIVPTVLLFYSLFLCVYYDTLVIYSCRHRKCCHGVFVSDETWVPPITAAMQKAGTAAPQKDVLEWITARQVKQAYKIACSQEAALYNDDSQARKCVQSNDQDDAARGGSFATAF